MARSICRPISDRSSVAPTAITRLGCGVEMKAKLPIRPDRSTDTARSGTEEETAMALSLNRGLSRGFGAASNSGSDNLNRKTGSMSPALSARTGSAVARIASETAKIPRPRTSASLWPPDQDYARRGFTRSQLLTANSLIPVYHNCQGFSFSISALACAEMLPAPIQTTISPG